MPNRWCSKIYIRLWLKMIHQIIRISVDNLKYIPMLMIYDWVQLSFKKAYQFILYNINLNEPHKEYTAIEK